MKVSDPQRFYSRCKVICKAISLASVMTIATCYYHDFHSLPVGLVSLVIMILAYLGAEYFHGKAIDAYYDHFEKENHKNAQGK